MTGRFLVTRPWEGVYGGTGGGSKKQLGKGKTEFKGQEDINAGMTPGKAERVNR